MKPRKRIAAEESGAQPTPERLRHAGPFVYRASRRAVALHDDALGRALHREVIDDAQHAALRLYARHWYVAGLAGQLGSPQLERVSSASAGDLRGDREIDALRIWQSARQELSLLQRQVAMVVACQDGSLTEAGACMGYRSPFRGREKAGELLAQAGQVLVRFWSRRH